MVFRHAPISRKGSGNQQLCSASVFFVSKVNILPVTKKLALQHVLFPVQVGTVKGFFINEMKNQKMLNAIQLFRYEAHKRLNREFIEVKLVKSTVTSLHTYLGSSTPDLR